jgi:hypothetical protein
LSEEEASCIDAQRWFRLEALGGLRDPVEPPRLADVVRALHSHVTSLRRRA